MDKCCVPSSCQDTDAVKGSCSISLSGTHHHHRLKCSLTMRSYICWRKTVTNMHCRIKSTEWTNKNNLPSFPVDIFVTSLFIAKSTVQWRHSIRSWYMANDDILRTHEWWKMSSNFHWHTRIWSQSISTSTIDNSTLLVSNVTMNVPSK